MNPFELEFQTVTDYETLFHALEAKRRSYPFSRGLDRIRIKRLGRQYLRFVTQNSLTEGLPTLKVIDPEAQLVIDALRIYSETTINESEPPLSVIHAAEHALDIIEHPISATRPYNNSSN